MEVKRVFRPHGNQVEQKGHLKEHIRPIYRGLQEIDHRLCDRDRSKYGVSGIERLADRDDRASKRPLCREAFCLLHWQLLNKPDIRIAEV